MPAAFQQNGGGGSSTTTTVSRNLLVITGRGKRSANGPQLQPAVVKYLTHNGYK
jgi:hypothetical protein